MFTPVCHSVHGGGGACSRGSGPRGVWPSEVPGLGWVPGPGGDAWWRHPPGQLLLWAVRILLECILVSNAFLFPTTARRTYNGQNMWSTDEMALVTFLIISSNVLLDESRKVHWCNDYYICSRYCAGVALIQNILVPGIESVKPVHASSTKVSATKVFLLLKW